MRPAFVWGLLTIIGLVLLSCMGLFLPIDVAFALLFGWAVYLGRVLPEVEVDRGGVATAALCLVLFAVGTHAFLGWLYGQIHSDGDRIAPRWRYRWTCSLVAGVVLMFVAGISAAGVAHQVGWLLASGEPFIESTSRFASLSQSRNNLKQFGLALHNYHEAHAAFPPGGTFDPTGRPLHGWQARLLPYIEQQDLYDRIDFDLPWDDPRNRPAFRTVVHEFLNPAIRPMRETNARGDALSHYAGNALLLGGDIPRSLDAVTDGTANTIIAGEVPGAFLPWGSPANWRDPALGINRSPQGFGGPDARGANILFADGSVRFVKDSVDPRIFEALGTPDGGESVAPEQY